MFQPTPVYRFFSKKEYAEDFFLNGNMRFTPTSAFSELEDLNYRDKGERYYNFKTREDHSKTIVVNGKEHKVEGGAVHSQYRQIEDAWAFCGTTSIVSTARKAFPTYIKDLGLLLKNLDKELQKKFNEKLLIMFGPVAYYQREMDLFSEVNCPPYFSKDEKFKSDLEFRIVIIPPNKIYKLGKLNTLTIEFDNPLELFGKTTILDKR